MGWGDSIDKGMVRGRGPSPIKPPSPVKTTIMPQPAPSTMTASEVLSILPNKGWAVIKGVRLESILVLVGSGYVKAHQVGNADDTYEVRLTGDGRAFLTGRREGSE